MRNFLRSAVVLATLASASALAEDMPGAADHPQIPRVAGTTIHGYERSDYDVGGFVSGVESNKLQLAQPEGVRTRLLYLAEPGASPVMVQRNYEVALAELGDVEEVYACRNDCSSRFSTHLWSREVQIPTHDLATPQYLIAFAHNYKTPAYRYARVVQDGTQLHVGVFTAVIASNNPNPGARDRTAVLLEVLEVADFEPNLVFVDAQQMRGEIDASGHVALYGIQFDHDQATLKAESNDTIAEIVTALKDAADLAIYVVGHTDGVGGLEYNQDLSLRRARAVVDALVAGGIARQRLTPLGVGPAAPLATNGSEDGRALNRRVELVQRL